VRISVVGPLTTPVADELWRVAMRVIDEPADVVELACEETEAIGLAALQIMAALGAELKQRGRRLQFSDGTASLLRAVQLAGFSNVLGALA
jgi:hypothetical protein